MLTPEQIAERLADRLRTQPELRAARARFSPSLGYGRHFGPAPHDVRAAAVLLLLYPGEHGWSLPLTVRPDHLSDHPGQVSLPGGMLEAGESVDQCALREWREELGADPAGFRLLGRAAPLYVFASNFLVTPCYAVAATRPQFLPNPAEVARVIEVPLAELRNPRRLGRHDIQRWGTRFSAPHLNIGGEWVWGATSMLLGELADRIAALAVGPDTGAKGDPAG